MQAFNLKKLDSEIRKMRAIERSLHYEQGFTIIPSFINEDGKKVPLIKIKAYLSRKQTDEEFEYDIKHKHDIFQLVCGSLFGLYAMDIDTKHDLRAIALTKRCFDKICPGLWEIFYRQKTINNGKHLLFRSNIILPKIEKFWPFFEVKGFGSPGLIASGRGYVQDQDSPDILHIPYLSKSQVQILLNTLESLPGAIESNNNELNTPGDNEFSKHLRREGEPPAEGDRHNSLLRDAGIIRNWSIPKYDQDDLIRGIGIWFGLNAVEIEGVINSTDWQHNQEVFDLSVSDVYRFISPPDDLPILISNLFIKSSVAALIAQAGAGKSTLALYLAILVVLSKKYPLSFLNRYDIKNPGDVLYVSTEEPEEELHRRVYNIVLELSFIVGIKASLLWNALQGNLIILNLWGQPIQLFNIDSFKSLLTPGDGYNRLINALNKLQDVAMVILDTRTRLSSAEGNGNVVVAQEFALYEALARKFNVVVLILHHVNKASYGDLSMNSGSAVRGESAFFDCVRKLIHLKPITDKIGKALNVEPNNYYKYSIFTDAKSNYLPMVPPFILKREGYNFEALPIPDLSIDKEEKKALKLSNATQLIVDYIKNNPGKNKRYLLDEANLGLSKALITQVLEVALSDGIIICKELPMRGGKAHVYFPVNNEKDRTV